MAWISWCKMTNSKRDGGLGFRDIQSFNDALLGKLSWRILNNPDCLLARILRGKYCKYSPLLEVQATQNCSHGWRSILIGRDLVKNHLGWAIDNGETVKIWSDSWLSTTQAETPMGPATEQTNDALVKTLFHANTCEWDLGKVETLLPEIAQKILSIKPRKEKGPGKRIWLKHDSGKYNTKSGYQAVLEDKPEEAWDVALRQVQWIKKVWELHTPTKIKLLIWKVIHGGLPVNERLAARNIIPTAGCGVCGAAEYIDHVFFSCPFSQEVWRMVPVRNDIVPLGSTRFVDNWIAVCGAVSLPPTGINAGSITAWIIWRLWTTRNYRIFQEKIFTSQEVVTKAIVDAKEWAAAQDKKTVAEPYKKWVGDTLTSGITCKTDAA